MKFLSPSLTAMLLAPPAQAQRGVNIQARTAGELAELCAANPKDALGDAKINFCQGYAQGAVDVNCVTPRARSCSASPARRRPAPQRSPNSWIGSAHAGTQIAECGGWSPPLPGRTLPLQVA